MLQRGRGTIFFTGATASIRGSKGFAAFSSAKFGLRALAQMRERVLIRLVVRGVDDRLAFVGHAVSEVHARMVEIHGRHLRVADLEWLALELVHVDGR